MNIFYLHWDQEECVQYYVDAHVRKMMLECLEMLRHAAEFAGCPYDAGYPLSRRHANHPCTKWTRAKTRNLVWHHTLGVCIYDEWKHRFGTPHKTGELLQKFPIHKVVSGMIAKLGDSCTSPMTPLPSAFGPWTELCCHGLNMTSLADSETAYRRYYVNAKFHLHKWTNRLQPDWLDDYRISHDVESTPEGLAKRVILL